MFFVKYLGARRRQTPGTHVNMKVPKDASHRHFSDAALRFDVAPRRSPSACPEHVAVVLGSSELPKSGKTVACIMHITDGIYGYGIYSYGPVWPCST